MFGSPIRQGYPHESPRYGPLLMADNSERDQLLPPAGNTDDAHLPGTPHHNLNRQQLRAQREAAQRPGTAVTTVHSDDEEDKGDDSADDHGQPRRRAKVPKFRIGSKRFEELLNSAVKQVSRNQHHHGLCMCVRACVRACVRVCMCVHVCVCVCV